MCVCKYRISIFIGIFSFLELFISSRTPYVLIDNSCFVCFVREAETVEDI